jgi:hypothetical protein
MPIAIADFITVLLRSSGELPGGRIAGFVPALARWKMMILKMGATRGSVKDGSTVFALDERSVSDAESPD